ncbi:hypothetical protein HDU79_011254 [Rhizoclosmatium sp. JEL0117]|nr:hypothetical protein HDU79_011254 [Rhizoclosmatium sp. JEL0117]
MVEWTETSFVASNGLRIAGKKYQHLSSSNGREVRILAVHGWLDNANSFDPFATNLFANLSITSPSITLISIDLPGHGHSDPLHRGQTYYLWDFALAIHDVSTSLNWDKFTLIGHSLGGHTSYLFAGTYPEKLESLVIIESIGFVNKLNTANDDAASMRVYMDRRRVLNLEEAGVKAESPRTVYESLDAAARVRMDGVTKVSLEAALCLCTRGCEAVFGGDGEEVVGYKLRTDKRLLMRHFFQWDHTGVVNIMRNISCDKLVVLGSASNLLREGDPLVVERMDALKSRKGGETQVVWVEGGTHHLHLEAETSAVVSNLVKEFLSIGTEDNRGVGLLSE